MKSLKDEIFSLKKDIVALSNRFDHRLQAMATALEDDYQQRMKNITLSYQALSALSEQVRLGQNVSVQSSECAKVDHGFSSSPVNSDEGEICMKTASAPETPDSIEHANIPTMNQNAGSAGSRKISVETEDEGSSKKQLMSPLMTLSGIATAMINHPSEQ